MIFQRPNQLTHIEIWFPRYHDKTHDNKEWVVPLAQYKVDAASPWIIIEFTKAQHLKGQRYCVKRSVAQTSPKDTNGKIPVYCVPMSKLENWDTVEEVKNVTESFGW